MIRGIWLGFRGHESQIVNDTYVCECYKNVSTLRRINVDCRAGDFGSHCTNSQLCIKGSLTRGTSSRAWTFVYQTIPIYQGYYSQFLIKTMFLKLCELISASASTWMQNANFQSKGSFTNYVYRFLAFFDPPPPPWLTPFLNKICHIYLVT